MPPDIFPWVILIAAIFTSNILLANFLGMCSFLACSKQIPTAVGLGAAVIFVMTCTSAINYAIHYGLLVPLGLGHLQFIIFIAVIAAFVQFVEMFVERFSQSLYYALGIFLPLITVNCAILGASLFMVNNVTSKGFGLWQVLTYGFGSGLGWFVAIMLMAGIRRRLKNARIPPALEGAGITLIITGIMAMAFVIFQGMVKI